MPRNMKDFYLERMGKALGFGKTVDPHPGTFSNNVRPVGSAARDFPAPVKNNVRIVTPGGGGGMRGPIDLGGDAFGKIK